MNACFSEKFLINGTIFSRNAFNNQIREGTCIYEVIRVVDGVCLFLEDHLLRFGNSLLLMNTDYNVSNIKRDISLLLKSNRKVDGNIRCELFIMSDKINLFSYYIEHHYPSNVEYNNGVVVKSLNVERCNPNAKVVHEDVKMKVDNKLKNSDIYEVALVNNFDLITEGSRSNLFFIKDNTVYTAPENMVLAGITRKYIINAIRKLNIELQEEAISINELYKCSAAFISGTSPKVLPISKFDNIEFNAQHAFIQAISKEYNNIIDQYIENVKRNEN